MQIEVFRSKEDLNKFLEKYRTEIIGDVHPLVNTVYDPVQKQFCNFYFFVLKYEYLGQRLPEDEKAIDTNYLG